jgi:hypothetical protein
MSFVKHQKSQRWTLSGMVLALSEVLTATLLLCFPPQGASSSLDDRTPRLTEPENLGRGGGMHRKTRRGVVSRPKVLGAFSNVKHIEDHGYGYVLQLWRQGDRIFGLFIDHSGQTGDPPTGLIEDVKFNPQTTQLSFKAKLSTGLISKGNYRDVPSRDVFRFRGTVSPNAVKGVLEISNALFPKEPATKKRIVLRKSAAMTQVMMDSKTYAEWKTSADEILRRLGPKW